MNIVKQNVMNIMKQNIGTIIIFVYMVVGVFSYNPAEISIALAGLFLLTAGWFWRQIIKNNLSFSFDIRNYPTDIKIIGMLFVFELILFIKNTFFSDLENQIYNWCILSFLLCFLYVYIHKKKENQIRLFDGVIYAGIVVMGMLLFAYAGNKNGIAWIANLISDKAVVASWALLVSVVGVISYCFCQSKMKSRLYLLAATLSFLILSINHYCISIWLLLFVFLLIPIIFRPTAELIKRDMQMLFLFMFILSNLSLISNYTDFLLVDVSLSLESSVYLEMLLAVGGIVFFHFWDRLPEGTDLNRISMLKLQKAFMWALCLTVIAFVGIVFGGNSWYELPDSMTGKVIKSAAVPVIRELAQGRSGLSMIIEYQGIVGLVLLIGLFYLILRKMFGNYHRDKQVTTACIIVSVIFLIQLLFFMPSLNVMPIYYTFFLFSAFITEDKKRVIIMKKQRHGGDGK